MGVRGFAVSVNFCCVGAKNKNSKFFQVGSVMMSMGRLAQSAVFLKLTMALSGLVLIGFLLAHLAGNLLVFMGPEVLNAYASGLRNYGMLLWGARLSLLLALIVHIASAVILTKRNRQAKPKAYAKQKSVAATYASRTMMMSGLIILSFVCYHLAHLTFRWTHPEFQQLADFDVYTMLTLSFRSVWVSFFYVLSIVLLMMHLSHGIGSFFQTLGLAHSESTQKFFRALGPVFGFTLALGFISIPTSIFFGWI